MKGENCTNGDGLCRQLCVVSTFPYESLQEGSYLFFFQLSYSVACRSKHSTVTLQGLLSVESRRCNDQTCKDVKCVSHSPYLLLHLFKKIIYTPSNLQ